MFVGTIVKTRPAFKMRKKFKKNNYTKIFRGEFGDLYHIKINCKIKETCNVKITF